MRKDTLMATSRKGNETEYVEIYLARNGRAYLVHTDTLKNTRQRHKMSLEQQRYVIMNWKAATAKRKCTNEPALHSLQESQAGRNRPGNFGRHTVPDDCGAV